MISEVIADELEHHIQRCSCAGTCTDITIHFKKDGTDLGVGKRLGKTRKIFPVHCAPSPGKQSGGSKDMRAGADTTHHYTVAMFLTQPHKDGFLFEFLTFTPEQTRTIDGRSSPDKKRRSSCSDEFTPHSTPFEAIIQLSIHRGYTPSVSLIAQHSIGKTEWFNRRRKRNHRKIWY